MFLKKDLEKNFASLAKNKRPFYLLGLMFFFWTLFDGLIAYIAPILITSRGFSVTQMGLIIASSNIFGMMFDFVLVKYLRSANYRRLFLLVYLLCFAYPVFLWFSKSIGMFLMSMMIWGLYGDLNNFAIYNFLGRHSKEEDHCKDSGIVDMSRGLGYLMAPIVAGILVVKAIDFFPVSLSLSFLAISMVLYVLITGLKIKEESAVAEHKAHDYAFFKEITILKKIGGLLFPVLLFNVAIHIFDALIWTIGPIYSQNFPDFKDFGGYFMTAYSLPTLMFLWLSEPMSKKLGKKRTAYLSFLLGCIFTLPIAFLSQPVPILISMFLASVASALSWPAIRGTFTDYMAESPGYNKEIGTLNDLSNNVGYIIGPIIGGIMVDNIGYGNMFLVISIAGISLALFLFLITPRSIRVVLHR